jgi:asparagine synthase (glutamine-hydrolysing)
MADAAGRFHVVFNGEIFNHRELRRELEGLGEQFRTRSDTEVLLHAYARWGRAMLRRLNGQFAFAIWDARERELFVARDRFGEKPLYWAAAPGGQVVLASEIKAILASGLVAPRIDRTSVDAYLGLYYVPPDRTIYENVHTLPPGRAAVFRAGVLGKCGGTGSRDFRATQSMKPKRSSRCGRCSTALFGGRRSLTCPSVRSSAAGSIRRPSSRS